MDFRSDRRKLVGPADPAPGTRHPVPERAGGLGAFVAQELSAAPLDQKLAAIHHLAPARSS